jgi:purine nucleoside phosphorylase
MNQPAIGSLGGRGFDDRPGVTAVESVELDTPFGKPSDAVVACRFADRLGLVLVRRLAGAA